MRLVRLTVWMMLCCSVVNAAPAGDLYATPGHLYRVGQHRVNLICLGSGRPVVVLDAGLGDWSPSWMPVQRRLASLTTTCAYDRAGYGFSEAARTPRTSVAIASELHALLLAAKPPPPYVLVGHSFGGLNQQAFADLYLGDVAGLVFVDSTVDVRFPPFLNRFTASQLAAGRQCASMARENAFRTKPASFERCFHWLWGLDALPNNGITPALVAAVRRQARHPAPYEAHVSEMTQLPTSQAEVRARARSWGSLPMVVLTATTHGENELPAALRDAMVRFEPVWRAAQDELAARSTCVRHDLLQSDHYIQFYRPQAVIDAITHVVSAVRAGGARCRLFAADRYAHNLVPRAEQ